MKQFSILLSFFAITIIATAQDTDPRWSLTGNSTATDASKLGTTNNIPLRLFTTNIERLRIQADGKVGIGITTPPNIFAVKTSGGTPAASWLTSGAPVFLGFSEATTTEFNLATASNTANARPVFQGKRSRGTLAAPTAVQNNDFLTSLLTSGYDGTNFQNPATIDFYVDGAPSAGNVPARISFVTGSNAGNRAERLKVGNTGNFTFNTNQLFLQKSTGALGLGTITPAASSIFDVSSTTKGVLLPRMTQAQRNAITSPATGLLVYQTDASPGFYYFRGGWQPLSSSSSSGANTTLSNLTAPTAINVDLNFSSELQSIQFPEVPTTINNPMITMFSAGTQNKDRMVLAHSPTYTNWGLQYQDSLDKFNFLSGGTPVLTTDLGSWRVGVGNSSPAARFDIRGTGSYDLAGSEGDFRLGDETYRLKMGVANAGGGAGDAYIASSHRLFLGAGTTLGRTRTMSVNSTGRVGIGTPTPAARLQVVGDTITTPVIQATVSYVGTSDVRGVTSFSKPADGWGYGVEGTGGFIGGYFSSLAGAYTGTGFGVYGTASGTAGTRIGVYGTASGGTVNNWGGYFPTKTYTSELRVGGEKGATGYVAAINGKLIATEVRVELLANWPDYVFDKGYKLMSLEDLEVLIKKEKHLPGVPAAGEVEENGIMLGEMQTKTMEKVEENTLYILQLNNKIKELEKIIAELTKKIK